MSTEHSLLSKSLTFLVVLNNHHFLPMITILCLFLPALGWGEARLLQENVRAQLQLFTLSFKTIIV
jgi:hypothetical protein